MLHQHRQIQHRALFDHSRHEMAQCRCGELLPRPIRALPVSIEPLRILGHVHDHRHALSTTEHDQHVGIGQVQLGRRTGIQAKVHDQSRRSAAAHHIRTGKPVAQAQRRGQPQCALGRRQARANQYHGLTAMQAPLCRTECKLSGALQVSGPAIAIQPLRWRAVGTGQAGKNRNRSDAHRYETVGGLGASFRRFARRASSWRGKPWPSAYSVAA